MVVAPTAVPCAPLSSAARIDPSPARSSSTLRGCAAARQLARQLKCGRGARAQGRARARAERTGIAGAIASPGAARALAALRAATAADDLTPVRAQQIERLLLLHAGGLAPQRLTA